jgi:hypothetical protein
MCKDVAEIIYFWHITGSGIIDGCPQQTLPKIEFSQPWSLYFVYSLPNCAAMQFVCHQKKIGLWPVWLQIRNIQTRLCLSWPKIRYSWTRIRLFWRPKIRYFPDKDKRELQGACFRGGFLLVKFRVKFQDPLGTRLCLIDDDHGHRACWKLIDFLSRRRACYPL